MNDKITKAQYNFYNQNKQALIDNYLSDFPLHIDPDAVRDRFVPVGYNRSNVQKFQGICRLLTKDIFAEALSRNKGKVRKVIFAAGLPASGKTSHLKIMGQNELVYDGTINNEKKFIDLMQTALSLGFLVEVFVYNVDAKRAFTSNLNRGDDTGRYVPISHYEKVAESINKRQELLEKHFKKQVIFRNFEHTSFEGKRKKFSNIIINRNELERIAKRHKFPNSNTLYQVIK